MHVGLEMAVPGKCLEVIGTYEHEFYIDRFQSRSRPFERDGRLYVVTFNAEQEYVNGGGADFSVLDMTDPANPTRLPGTFEFPYRLAGGNSPIKISEDTNYAYLSAPAINNVPGTPGHFYVLDISDLENPGFAGGINTPTGSTSIGWFEFDEITPGTFWGGRVGSTPNGVATIDATDPTNPVIADFVSAFVQGGYTLRPSSGGLYALTHNIFGTGIEIYNVNDIYNISLTYSGNAGMTFGFTNSIFDVVGDRLYIFMSMSGGAHTLNVLNCANPSSPVLEAVIPWVNKPSFTRNQKVVNLETPTYITKGGIPPSLATRLLLYKVEFPDPITPVITEFSLSAETVQSISFEYEDLPEEDSPTFSVSPLRLDGKTSIIQSDYRTEMWGILNTGCVVGSKLSRRAHSIPNQPNTRINDPVPEMGDPVVLWNTRHHVHGSDWLYNEGTGGDVWDLPIDFFTPGVPNDGYWGNKKRDWYTHDPPTIGDNFPVDWSDFGGDLCQSPVTFMAATPEYPTEAEADLWGGEQNTEIFFDSNFNNEDYIGHNIEFILDAYDDQPYWEGFAGFYGRTIGDVGNENGTFTEWYPEDETDRGTPVPHRGAGSTLFVQSVDFRRQTYQMWILWAGSERTIWDGRPGVWVNGGEEPFNYPLFVQWPGNPYCEFDSWGTQTGRMFIGIGYHDGKPHSGEGWSHVTGAVYARGVPTAAQRRQWWNYFFS